MLNIKHRTEIISVIAALCIAIFVVMASLFMANTISALDGEVNNYIDRAASQKCDIVESAIRNDVNTVKNFAACANNYKNTDENLVIKMIKDLENSCSTIDAFIIADENGDVITSKNISKNISAREYYKRAMNGEVYISKAIYSEPDEKMVNAIAAPIYGDYKRIVGMVAGICDKRSYNNLIDMSFGGKENDSNGYVLNSDGEVIMSGENALGDYVPCLLYTSPSPRDA